MIRGAGPCLVALQLCAVMGTLLGIAFGQQTSPVPYGNFSGLDFSNSQLDHAYYPQTYRSIRDVDFRNLTLCRFEEAGSFTCYPLKNGSWEYHNDLEFAEIDIAETHYLGEDYALLLLDDISGGGSTDSRVLALLFQLSNQRLRSVQQLSWGWADSYNPRTKLKSPFDPSTSTLTVRTDHYMPGDSHCCVSAMDVITLHWDGALFQQTSFETELTDEGKDEGKTLHP